MMKRRGDSRRFLVIVLEVLGGQVRYVGAAAGGDAEGVREYVDQSPYGDHHEQGNNTPYHYLLPLFSGFRVARFQNEYRQSIEEEQDGEGYENGDPLIDEPGDGINDTADGCRRGHGGRQR